MYEIVLSQTAEKQLLKLEKAVRDRLINSLERIKIRPEAHITKLVGDEGYKFRVGDYRIILELRKAQLLILVIKIGHRKNIYKK